MTVQLQTMIVGYTDFATDLVSQGYRPYLLTIIFRHLHGSAIDQMKIHTAKLFYSKWCTRFCRSPRSPSQQKYLPRVLLFPDRPVYKRNRVQHQNVQINEGMHFHGLAFVPSVSRFKGNVVADIISNQCHYSRGAIQQVHIKPIDHDMASTVDYVMKSLKRGIEPDDILILPYAVSELPDRKCSKDTPVEDADSRIRSVRVGFVG